MSGPDVARTEGRTARLDDPVGLVVGAVVGIVVGLIVEVVLAAAAGPRPDGEHAARVAAAAASPMKARRPSTVGAGCGSGPVTGAGWHRSL